MANPAHTVLLAVDGSHTAQHAFDWYVENVHHHGNQLLVVHSIEVANVHVHPSIFVKQEVQQAQYERQVEEDKGVQEIFEAKLKETNIPGRYITKPGRPEEVVIEVSKEEKVDFIVIGSRGMGTIRRTVLGSVSTYVLHHAHCPVIVVHKEKKSH